MKKIKFFAAVVAAMIYGNASAQTITASDVSIEAGGTADVTFTITSESKAALAEFDLVLPDGITIAYDEDNEDYVYAKGADMTNNNHVVNISKKESGAFYVLVYHSKGNEFKEVFDLPFCKRNKFPEKRFITANTQAKSIIRTNVKGFKVTSPHCFLDVPTVDALGRPCWKAIRLGDKPVWKGAWLNHYRFKTVEEYVSKKMVRLWPTAYRNGGKDCYQCLLLPLFYQIKIP